MKKFVRFLKFFFLTLYFIGISYLIIKKDFLSLSEALYFLIPIIFFLSIFILWIIFIKTFYNKNRYEDEFTTIVNHTFRTPLTNINWTTNELTKELTQEEKNNLLQNINNSTGKLLDIVDLFVGVKSIDDRSSYNFKATSIRELIEKSIIKYRREINKKNISLQVSPFKDVPLLTVDLKKIHFVVDTLIENAVLYTLPNGKITIDSVLRPNKLIFFVSDSGIGLSIMNKLRLFSKFYRGQRARHINTDGMGLRLYLAKRIIRRHKGKIYFKSRGENQGTTFFIELPFKK